MQIITIATFYDEEKKEDIQRSFTFNLIDIGDANETANGYTCITNNSTGIRTEIQITFKTYCEILEKKHFDCKKIIE